MRRKFGNRVTGGYHSKKESNRAAELRLLEKIGEISDLREQVKFELIPKQEGERAVTYTADFAYMQNGEQVIEDVKGWPDDRWPLKRKLMLWRHGIRVKVV